VTLLDGFMKTSCWQPIRNDGKGHAMGDESPKNGGKFLE